MNITKALGRSCRGHKVRPTTWRTINPDHWIEFRHHVFVECGKMEEIPHALRLMHPDEFLGEWETIEGMLP